MEKEKMVTMRTVVWALVMTLMMTCMTATGENALAKKALKPGRITKISAANKGNQITVKWVKVKSAKKYQMYIVEKNSSGKKSKKTKSVKKTRCSFKGRNGHEYIIKVRGINGKKKGKYSKAVVVILKSDKTDNAGGKDSEKDLAYKKYKEKMDRLLKIFNECAAERSKAEKEMNAVKEKLENDLGPRAIDEILKNKNALIEEKNRLEIRIDNNNSTREDEDRYFAISDLLRDIKNLELETKKDGSVGRILDAYYHDYYDYDRLPESYPEYFRKATSEYFSLRDKVRDCQKAEEKALNEYEREMNGHINFE